MVIGSKEWEAEALAKTKALDWIVDRLLQQLRPILWSAVANYLNPPQIVQAAVPMKQKREEESNV